MMNGYKLIDGTAHIGVVSYGNSPLPSLKARCNISPPFPRHNYTHHHLSWTSTPDIKRIPQIISNLQVNPLFGKTVFVTVSPCSIAIISILQGSRTAMAWINAYITLLREV